MKLTRRLVAGITAGMILGMIAGLSACTEPKHLQAEPTGPVVKITASKFHFTPNHITLIKGQAVTLELTSDDVTHGFMIRPLKIDTDIKPGRLTDITVTPAMAGTFKVICDHYCGFGHGDMRMTVVVQEAAAKSSSKTIVAASNTVSK